MKDHVSIAQEMRANTQVHWNCCQTVIGAFAEDCGLTLDQAYKVANNFAAGMKIGSVCGAITGGLMVLGLMDAGEEARQKYIQHFRQERGALTCAELLKIDRDKGHMDKKPHCDKLIYESIRLVEELVG